MHYLQQFQSMMASTRKTAPYGSAGFLLLLHQQEEVCEWSYSTKLKGNVMTMLAGMSEEVDDEDIKEELMRCFSNAPTTIQAIQVLRAMQQRPGEIARLYTARYEIIHYRCKPVDGR